MKYKDELSEIVIEHIKCIYISAFGQKEDILIPFGPITRDCGPC